MQHLISIGRIKLDRAEQEKQWQSGKGRMIRDFATLKDFYSVRHTYCRQRSSSICSSDDDDDDDYDDDDDDVSCDDNASYGYNASYDVISSYDYGEANV
jgi:hypothetical protein